MSLILVVWVLTSCNEDEKLDTSLNMSEVESADFFKKNISIYDARVRSINEQNYVKELYLANFSSEQWDKKSIGFEGLLFEDNGLGNDLIANDQIFTSVNEFPHTSNVQFVENNKARSVLNTPIISPEFIRKTELEILSNEYTLNRETNSSNRLSGPVATLECDVEICSSGCIADWVWDGFGCVSVSNCRAKIGWE